MQGITCGKVGNTYDKCSRSHSGNCGELRFRWRGMVRSVLNVNKAERHIRGGKATRDKYAVLRQCAGDVTADR